MLLIEQVDRLSRLTENDWRKLRTELDAKQLRVVALDLPTSWLMATAADEFTSRMFAAVNGMMLDVLAAVARKDYDDRRRRQAEGIVKAKADGAYRGRPETTTAWLVSRPCSWAARRVDDPEGDGMQPSDHRQGRKAESRLTRFAAACQRSHEP